MNHEIMKLANGVRVVAAPMKERTSISIGIWVQVGARDEAPRISGISHFLEHLVFKGTSRRTAKQIKEAVEGVGGSLNAFTGEEYTCFLAKTTKRHFKEVFDVLSDMVLDASLSEEDIQKERAVVMEEIKMTQDQPSQYVEELLSEILWPEHALGRPIAGTLESVGNLTREDILGFRNHFYAPNLISVIAAGDISEDELLQAASPRFLSGTKPRAEKALDLFRSSNLKPRVRLYSKATEQTHLALGIPAFEKEHPDQYVLDVLNILLGGNMSSRLFNEVREERGLAYEIGSSERQYHETGAFIVSAGVDNKKVKEALRVILSELIKTSEELVSPKELERAKEFYVGQLELGLESGMSRMLWIGENVLSLNRCKTLKEIVEQVDKITAPDLQRVAKMIFKSDSLHLAAIGPKIGEFEADLRKILTFSR